MKIDLGCGRNKPVGYFGVDCQDFPGVDLVCDANEILPLQDNIADEVRAFDFLEHVRNDCRIHIMNEIWRILKPGGILISKTPSTDGRGAFQDPTHYSFWNEQSFLYYTNDTYRALYKSIVAKFEIISISTKESDVIKVLATLKAIK